MSEVMANFPDRECKNIIIEIYVLNRTTAVNRNYSEGGKIRSPGKILSQLFTFILNQLS